MFRQVLLPRLLFIGVVLLPFCQLRAQEEEGEIFVISERVGEEIDQEERERFELFQGVNGFQSAIYIKMPDNKYLLTISYIDERIGELRIRRTELSETEVNLTREHIDGFGKIHARKPQMENSDAEGKEIYVTLRLGKGASGELGGASQMSLDIKPDRLPIAISISGEAYRRMPLKKRYAEPDDAWVTAVNVLYMTRSFRRKRVNPFLGGGVGRLELDKYERTEDPTWRDEPYAVEKGIMYNLEAGVNIRLFGPIGFYGIGKYLYAKKKRNGIEVIDIDSTSWLVGLTINFGLSEKSESKHSSQ